MDALGNTTAATGKGFVIGSGVLTPLSLINAFSEIALVLDTVKDVDGGIFKIPSGCPSTNPSFWPESPLALCYLSCSLP